VVLRIVVCLFEGMLSLQAWCGLVASPRNVGVNIKVVSKLGGKIVGHIAMLDSEDCNLVLQDMQRQIAKLMPHKSRDSRDVVIYVSSLRVTPLDFGYKFQAYQDSRKHLDLVQTLKQVEAMWDEADEHALNVLQMLVPENLTTVNARSVGGPDGQVVVTTEVLPDEMRALPHHFKVWCLCIRQRDHYAKLCTKDMQVMKRICIDACFLRCVLPSNWNDLAHIVHLVIRAYNDFNFPVGLCLPKLERLGIIGPTTNLPQTLGKLLHLTLKSTKLRLDDVMRFLEATPSLAELELITNSFKQAIPTEFGKLTHLRELLLIQNGFSGGLPDEISCLTNLTKLVVKEPRHSFDPVICQSICKLKIPDKDVRRTYNLDDRYVLCNVWRV
jgi:hypothetical protein